MSEVIGPPRLQFFRIDWEPVAKGRPRLAVVGGNARAYTPAKTRHAEASIRYLIRKQEPICLPRDTPLCVSIVFRCARPKSLPKRVLFHTKKPDLDNLLKTILDAGNNGLLWWDDAQIVSLSVRKEYTVSSPEIVVQVQEAR